MLSVVSVCLPGLNGVAERAEVDELRDLRLAHDQLRAVLDRLVVVRKAVRQRVARVIGPLDDVDQFALEEVCDAHRRIVAASSCRSSAVGNQLSRLRSRINSVRPAPTRPSDHPSCVPRVVAGQAFEGGLGFARAPAPARAAAPDRRSCCRCRRHAAARPAARPGRMSSIDSGEPQCAQAEPFARSTGRRNSSS